MIIWVIEFKIVAARLSPPMSGGSSMGMGIRNGMNWLYPLVN